MQTTYLKINPADSVVVCLSPKKKGDLITVDGRQIAKRQRGVNIVRSFDANGKVTVKKVVVE